MPYLLQGIFPTQEFNPGLPLFRWILYHLSHREAWILDWVASPGILSGILPNPGIEPASPALQVNSLPAELPGKPISALKQENEYLGYKARCES